MALNGAMNNLLIPILVLLAFSSTGHGQSALPASVVQVLVLDYKTGLPVKGREVEMILPNTKGDVYEHSPRIIKKTGKNGIAVFHISSPLPPEVLQWPTQWPTSPVRAGKPLRLPKYCSEASLGTMLLLSCARTRRLVQQRLSRERL